MGTKNVMPTTDKRGEFQGRVTVLGVCGCGKNHPRVRFEDDDSICKVQTDLALVLGDEKTAATLKRVAATLSQSAIEAVEEKGLTAEEAVAMVMMTSIESVEIIIMSRTRPRRPSWWPFRR